MINTSNTQQPNTNPNTTIPNMTPPGQISSEEKAYLNEIRWQCKRSITPWNTPHTIGKCHVESVSFMLQLHMKRKDYEKELEDNKNEIEDDDLYNDNRMISRK